MTTYLSSYLFMFSFLKTFSLRSHCQLHCHGNGGVIFFLVSKACGHVDLSSFWMFCWSIRLLCHGYLLHHIRETNWHSDFQVGPEHDEILWCSLVQLFPSSSLISSTLSSEYGKKTQKPRWRCPQCQAHKPVRDVAAGHLIIWGVVRWLIRKFQHRHLFLFDS